MAPQKSPVWKYLVKDTSKVARCKICGHNVSTSGNTSNAWAHLAQHGVNQKNALDAASLAKTSGPAAAAAGASPSTSGAGDAGAANPRRRRAAAPQDLDDTDTEGVEVSFVYFGGSIRRLYPT